MKLACMTIAAAMLAGCMTNMTPEQRAAYAQMVRENLQAQTAAQQANLRATQQALTAAGQTGRSTTTNCTTTFVGNQAHTNCR